jgi:glycosyltransferase involved in cell wall biosynthesis
MTQEKGHRELIEAIGHLRRQHESFYVSLRLWLVGDGPLRPQLESLAQSLEVTDCVEFVGHVAQPAPWIAAADALCLPSKFEGFPNVMLEAMALGTPVIASDIPVVRSLGRISSDPNIRGKTYLAMYPSGDSANLARKIVSTRQNSTATRSRRLFAEKLAREALAVHTIVPRLEAIMLSVVQEKSFE